MVIVSLGYECDAYFDRGRNGSRFFSVGRAVFTPKSWFSLMYSPFPAICLLSLYYAHSFRFRSFWSFRFDLFGLSYPPFFSLYRSILNWHSFLGNLTCSIRKSKSFWAKKLCCYFISLFTDRKQVFETNCSENVDRCFAGQFAEVELDPFLSAAILPTILIFVW